MEETCGTEPWNILDYIDDDGQMELINGVFVFDSDVSLYGHAASNKTTEESLVTACDAVYRNEPCKAKVCKIELNFARQLVIEEIELASTIYSHEGGFDPLVDDLCSVEDGVKSPKSCCGDYPHKFPYKTNSVDGERACCGSKTYDPNFHRCCANGKIDVSC